MADMTRRSTAIVRTGGFAQASHPQRSGPWRPGVSEAGRRWGVTACRRTARVRRCRYFRMSKNGGCPGQTRGGKISQITRMRGLAPRTRSTLRMIWTGSARPGLGLASLAAVARGQFRECFGEFGRAGAGRTWRNGMGIFGSVASEFRQRFRASCTGASV